MGHKKKANIVEKIQVIAEDIHCASAIIAAESILEERLKQEMNKELNAISVKMDNAIAEDDLSLARKLLNDKNKLFDQLKTPRIRIRYAPLVKDVNKAELNGEDFALDKSQPAACVYDDETIYIVLPLLFQDVIRDGVKENLDVWTPKMKLAKTILRYLTAHELFHIVSPTATDSEVVALAKKLLDQRNLREKARAANNT